MADHSVDHMFSLYFDYISRFFLVLRAGYGTPIASVPGLCILFTFSDQKEI